MDLEILQRLENILAAEQIPVPLLQFFCLCSCDFYIVVLLVFLLQNSDMKKAKSSQVPDKLWLIDGFPFTHARGVIFFRCKKKARHENS
jgi:hypothetical protein